MKLINFKKIKKISKFFMLTALVFSIVTDNSLNNVVSSMFLTAIDHRGNSFNPEEQRNNKRMRIGLTRAFKKMALLMSIPVIPIAFGLFKSIMNTVDIKKIEEIKEKLRKRNLEELVGELTFLPAELVIRLDREDFEKLIVLLKNLKTKREKCKAQNDVYFKKLPERVSYQMYHFGGGFEEISNQAKVDSGIFMEKFKKVTELTCGFSPTSRFFSPLDIRILADLPTRSCSEKTLRKIASSFPVMLKTFDGSKITFEDFIFAKVYPEGEGDRLVSRFEAQKNENKELLKKIFCFIEYFREKYPGPNESLDDLWSIFSRADNEEGGPCCPTRLEAIIKSAYDEVCSLCNSIAAEKSQCEDISTINKVCCNFRMKSLEGLYNVGNSKSFFTRDAFLWHIRNISVESPNSDYLPERQGLYRYLASNAYGIQCSEVRAIGKTNFLEPLKMGYLVEFFASTFNIKTLRSIIEKLELQYEEIDYKDRKIDICMYALLTGTKVNEIKSRISELEFEDREDETIKKFSEGKEVILENLSESIFLPSSGDYEKVSRAFPKSDEFGTTVTLKSMFDEGVLLLTENWRKFV
ncbi:MAG: hypothetical protein LBK29_04195 [Oscillospiraceae bacterium]|jgi:hypothetical protein|nr:hypothetical protein [Oscillospiraceae bacterium]